LLRDKERGVPRRYGAREGELMIPAHLPVDDVMERWPATIRVFLDLRMRCVGCPIARFHTVADAAHLHGIAREAFLGALREAADEVQPVIASEAKQSRGRKERAGLLRFARNDEESRR
jgi:hybrid cluster-associated redox disulfide protein